MNNDVNKESTVPTAIAFIGFIAIAFFCFFIIRDNVIKNKIQREEQETKEVGKIANYRVMIGGKFYTVTSESNKGVESFVSQLPIEIEMNDSTNNLKKGYTYYKLSTSPKKIGSIEIGDILLSGESYVLIATKSFKSSEKYTKLGHIINLGELPSGTIKVTFIKGE